MREKSTTGRNDLTKLPALKPLIERDQWTVYREEKREDGSISRRPRQAHNPDYPANINDPNTWSDHATAAKAVMDGKADGLQFVLTKDDPFAFLDLDDGRDQTTGSIDSWAQGRLDQFNGAYMEVSPSNDGVHVVGETSNGANKKNRAFHLTINGKSVAVEAYYHSKALTVTGRQIGKAKKLVNVDKPLQQTIAWGERTKAKLDTRKKGNGKSSKFSIADLDRIVREGPINGGNRSEQFHSVVGHYFGIGRSREQVCEVFEKHPGGVAKRYISKGLLDQEVDRSFCKFEEQAKAKGKKATKKNRTSASVKVRKAPFEPAPELETTNPEFPQLPQFFAYGEQTGSRTHREWLVKGLVPRRGLGLLSGQWGTFKTFVALDLAIAICTGEEFLNHKIKRQCGVLLLAYEGAFEVELRATAIVADKYGDAKRIPFRWYDDTELPKLTDEDGLEKLVAMAKEIDADLQLKFDRRLGLIIIDTLMTGAGYQGGGENDAVAVQDVMDILKKLGQECDVFVLAVDHYGKNVDAGTRGSSAKESAVDLVLACLGKKPDGTVPEPIFNVRKCRGGRQGQKYPFTHREVVAPEPDEDGEPVTTLVLDWLPPKKPGETVRVTADPWEKSRQGSLRTSTLQLKRDLTAALTTHGIDQLVDGTQVNMVALDIVRDRFFSSTPAEGTTDQKRKARSQLFRRALDWARKEQLVGVGEVQDVSYLWLIREQEDDTQDDRTGTEDGEGDIDQEPAPSSAGSSSREPSR